MSKKMLQVALLKWREIFRIKYFRRRRIYTNKDKRLFKLCCYVFLIFTNAKWTHMVDCFQIKPHFPVDDKFNSVLICVILAYLL